VDAVNRHRPLSAAIAGLVAMVAIGVPAAPAMAHTELSRTVPAARSTTTEPVTAVTLTFTGLIKKPATTVVVTGPDKTSYSSAGAEVLDKTVTQKVNPLPVGAITVAWRTVAADGHPIKGSFTFTNRAAPPTPTAEATPTAEPTPTAATAPATGQAAPTPVGQASDDGPAAPVVLVVVGAVVLPLAALGGLLWRRRRRTGVPSP
jgi:methionine-rich copper-binding protein CopC